MSPPPAIVFTEAFRSQRVMAAMLKMKKIDIGELERAAKDRA